MLGERMKRVGLILVVCAFCLPLQLAFGNDTATEKSLNEKCPVETCDGREERVLADFYALCRSITINKDAFVNFGNDWPEEFPQLLAGLAVSPFLSKEDKGSSGQAAACIKKYGKKEDSACRVTVEEMIGICNKFTKDKEKLSFWFPEYYLLLNEKTQIASDKSTGRWKNNLGLLDKDPFVLPPLILNGQPLLTGKQWRELKETVRKRWHTKLGRWEKTKVIAWLQKHHTMAHFPDLIKPSFGGRGDLRGIEIDKSFQIVGCNFGYIDLWAATFIGAKLFKAEFTGAKVADVLFKDVDLTESIFTGTADKYGPHYSTFRKATLKGTVWKDAKINGVVFSDTDLNGSIFKNCHFSNTLFLSTNLTSVVFENCIFGENVKFYDCNLKKIYFKNSRLPFEVFTVPANIADIMKNNAFSVDEISHKITPLIVDFYDGEPSFIGKASAERKKDTVSYIIESLKNARVEGLTAFLYRLQGVEGKPLFFFSREEKDGDSFCVLCEHIGANFLEFGSKEAYRTWYVRGQVKRVTNGLDNYWQILESVSSGYGTQPGKAVFFFFFLLSILALFFVNSKEMEKFWDGRSIVIIVMCTFAGYILQTGILIENWQKVILEISVSVVVLSLLVVRVDTCKAFKKLFRSAANLFFAIIPGVDPQGLLVSNGKNTSGDNNDGIGRGVNNIKWKIGIALLQIYLIYQATRIIKMWWI